MKCFFHRVESGWLFFVLCFIFLFSFQKKGCADEYDTLRIKWRDYQLGGNYNPTDSDITYRLDSLVNKANNFWATMDKTGGRTYLWSEYPDGGNTSSSDITNTYSCLKTMAQAYAMNGSSLKDNPTLRIEIINGLDWLYSNWYNENKTQFGNWWDWDIGTTKILTDITAILYDDLSSSQINNYMNAIAHFIPASEGTAANRIDTAQATALRGILMKTSSTVAGARDSLSVVFDYVTTSDGFYSDGSFIQHTNIAYTNSYGTDLINGVVDIVYLLQGSSWEVTDTDKSNIYKWIYDSYEPTLYKGASMDMLRGRAISRDTSSDHREGALNIATIIKFAQVAPPADAVNFKGMVKRWINEDTSLNFFYASPIYYVPKAREILNDSQLISKPDLVAHYEYNNMDRSVHLTSGFAFGVSKSSKRIARYELTNGENHKGWYTGDGQTYLYNNDLAQFADDFWPTVNYYRLPGTTVDTRPRSIGNYQEGDGEGCPPNAWSGGTTLGASGVSGMDLMAYGSTLVAKKSWFMFDDEIVAFGAGITSTDNRTIETIVEQRKLNEPGNNVLTVNGVLKPTSLGWSEAMNGVSWVHLASTVTGSDIGYYFPGGASVKGLRQAQSGTWSEINDRGAIDVRTRNYLTLWFDHGLNPSNAAYIYVLLPNKTLEQVRNYVANPNIRVVENSSQAQCVIETTLNIVAANFWADAKKTVDIITSDKKASIIIKEVPGISLEVAVTDPTMENTGLINVELNRMGGSTLSSDPGVTVTQVSPTIKFQVNVNGSQGKIFMAKFNLTPIPPSPPKHLRTK